ncbi:PLP-dependent aminotransferase family protein [Sandaracinus amylolyticus]|uniref:Transcriptional regulator, GntR family protein n=1 Tax=Sandaracinus amylolyticus TaxID=927083 RepID=A0A0F6YHP0_9BACT|nr:PLP-dependent aminotransferase family protein [Sandaracinus amylolyticus]AKF04316.1 Transcriptional regulator, GntR family protein [Sandaracinus amylolyticus]
MSRHEEALALDPDELRRTRGPSLAARVANLLVSEIRRGRLRPGQRLPGTRALAASLEVERDTVVRAFAELVAEGWLASRPQSGTFVAAELPERTVRRPSTTRTAVPEHAAFARPPLSIGPVEALSPATIYLGGGVPDVRLVPREALARAHRRVLRTSPRTRLDYGDARGEATLRRALACMLGEQRAIATDADGVLVTHGSQHAIDLVARTIVRPGDRVAIEDPGYPPARQTFRLSGAALVPIPVDARGLDLSALERACDEAPIRALYVTPHHQYPTMVVMAPERRQALLALARRRRFAIIEDDYDHEFHFEGRPVLPLASADVHGSVVYVGSLSKMLAPGLRLGFVVPPRDLLEDLVRVRFASDRQGDHAKEAAVASLIDDGELARHVRRVRRVYLARRDVLRAELRRAFGERIHIEERSGGLALWAKLDADVERIRDRALERGVMFFVARDFTFDRRSLPFARFGFGSLDERELTRAVGVVARAARTRA